MKTLIIEDDSSANSIFVRYFENYGACDSATTGFDGMQKFMDALNSGDLYNLVIIDIILPDMNGYQLLETIRLEEDMRKFSNSERAKIILTTSLDDEENRKLIEKLKYGYETYYVKSFALDGIEKNLKELGIKL
jgi:two-component system chemotaxis response regulator CheY